MSDVSGFRWFCPSSFGAYNIVLSLELFLFVVCSSPQQTDVSWSWHLQHLGIFNAIPASLSQINAIVSQDLYAGTPLPRVFSSMVNKGRLHVPFTHVSFMPLKPEAHG